MKKKRILITGSRGFIGSHLAVALQDSYELIEFDLKLKRNIFDLENLHGIDLVVHLAALTSVQESRLDPERYYYTNVIGTAWLVKLCIDARAQMLFFSSAAAGRPLTSPYANSKWLAEKLVESMKKPLRAVIFRPENVYGIGMNKDSLFARFLHNDMLTVYGDGKQTRDFINIIDVVNITRFAIANQWENVSCDIGTGKATSVAKVAELFAKYTRKKVVMLPGVEEVKHSKANIRKLSELYPYPLVTNLEKDIQHVIQEVS